MNRLFLLPFAVALIFNSPSSSAREGKAATPRGPFVDRANTVIAGARQITFVGTRSGEGYFSADGRKMIFQSEREPGNPFYQMYLLDMESGATTRLSPGQGKTTCGWIHPSGKKVMWSSTHLDPATSTKAKAEFEERAKPVKARYSWSYDETYDIFESDLQGRSLRRLTKERGYDAEGSYSPDGQWIAFASNRAGYTESLSEEEKKIFDKDPSYMMDLYIMRADGSDVRRLTTARGYDGGPFFSPDGRRITFRRFAPNGATAEIYSIGVDGRDEKQLTNLGVMSWAPYYHPSGDYVVFASSVLGHANFELFVVDSEGLRPPARVTFGDGFDGLATFTPDGRQISWTRRNEKGESQIYLADWDDAQVRRLLDLPALEPGRIALSPDLSEGDLRTWVGWLASEDKAGRRSGSAEERLINERLVRLLQSWGLEGAAPGGGFFHHFEFTSAVRPGPANAAMLVGPGGRELRIGREAEPYSLSASAKVEAKGLVFAGFGIKAPAADGQPGYDSYDGLDVKDKWVVVLPDRPTDVPAPRRHFLSSYARLQHKVTVAREQGAAGLIVWEGFQEIKPQKDRALRFEGALSAASLPVWRWSGPWLKTLAKNQGWRWESELKALEKGELRRLEIKGLQFSAVSDLQLEKSKATNVVARLRAKKSQGAALLIGAHGDHLGRGESGSSLARNEERDRIHPGADDNASGVASVMELAHHFAEGRRTGAMPLTRDLIFAIWSAEEIGLLGSAAWIRDWEEKSKKPLAAEVAAALNLDMVGRLRDRLMVQGVGSADHWTRLVEESALRVGLPISAQEDPYLPTDAMSFYLAGLPSISFFTGAHEEYHSPRDTADTLNYPGLRRVTEAVAILTSLLADTPAQMLNYQRVAGSASSRMEGRSFRVYVGTIPDYGQEGVKGLRISGVSKDSPAEKAGLRPKDIIIEFGGTRIETIYDYVYSLQSAKPGEKTQVRVRRGDREVVMSLTPALKDGG